MACLVDGVFLRQPRIGRVYIVPGIERSGTDPVYQRFGLAGGDDLASQILPVPFILVYE